MVPYPHSYSAAFPPYLKKKMLVALSRNGERGRELEDMHARIHTHTLTHTLTHTHMHTHTHTHTHTYTHCGIHED